MTSQTNGFRRIAALLAGLACCFWSPGVSAQTTAPATPEPATRIPAKNLAEKQCFAYSNVKATFLTEGEDTILRLAFGTGDGLFGGAWFPIPAPKIEPSQCRGIGLTVRGNGSVPGKAFLVIKNGKGAAYRSKDLSKLFADKSWQDVLLTADDFALDAAIKPEIAKDLPKQPDWSSLNRLEFAAVNLEAEPAIEFKGVYFVMGKADAAAPTSAPAAAEKPAEPTAKPAAPAAAPSGPVLQSNAGSDALTPIAKAAKFPDGTWLERHEKFVARAKQGDVDLLWLGDSITDNWNRNKATYRTLYPNIKAANFGIGGDGTQNLLWRLENGELDGIQPKVAIVLIGANNVQWHASEQIAAAIERIVKTIRTQCPKAKVLLMGILPRADVPASSPAHQRTREVNAIIRKLDDGRNVRYLDIGSKLTHADGTIVDDAFADKVHLSPKGFTLWAESMQPLLDEMMK